MNRSHSNKIVTRPADVSLAFLCATSARDLHFVSQSIKLTARNINFNWYNVKTYLIINGQFLLRLDVVYCKDSDTLFSSDLPNLSIFNSLSKIKNAISNLSFAIWITWMIDESGIITEVSSIDDQLLCDAEEVEVLCAFLKTRKNYYEWSTRTDKWNPYLQLSIQALLAFFVIYDLADIFDDQHPLWI